jgi:hypothetical protein
LLATLAGTANDDEDEDEDDEIEFDDEGKLVALGSMPNMYHDCFRRGA